MSAPRRRRTRHQAFTLPELVVVLLVLGVTSAIAIPTFRTVRERAVERAAQSTLEAAARSGEAIAASDPDATDELIAAAVETEFTDDDGRTVTVGTGDDSDTVTVVHTNGSLTATGSVEFVDGAALVTGATTDGSGGTTLGATGPGGGIVFYVDSDGFACGPTLNLTCTYLEAAPAGWHGGEDPTRAWSGNTDTTVGTSGLLGHGYANTLAATAQDSTPDRAITLAHDYANDGRVDWFLPSNRELNELCKYARQQPTGDTSVACNSSSSLRTGFSSWPFFWGSSERSATTADADYIGSDGFIFGGTKTNAYQVRPIRAF